MNATQNLARYALELNYREFRREVIERAKICILDTLAVSLYGSTKPWSKTRQRFCPCAGAKGNVHRLRQHAKSVTWSAPRWPMARWRMPSNSTMYVNPVPAFIRALPAFLPAFAMAEMKREPMAKRCSPRSSLAAKSCHGSESPRGTLLSGRGFHAPGLTGTFGAAVAAGRLLSLNEKQLVNALGIAGSYSGGLIEFSRCQEGAMIKRLHLGKAAEGGVTAAQLAHRGFAGPEERARRQVWFLPDFFRLAQT